MINTLRQFEILLPQDKLTNPKSLNKINLLEKRLVNSVKLGLKKN